MQTIDDKLLRRCSNENLYLSDEENISDDDVPSPQQGKLYKWTNMLHGWQERFFHLKDGVLSYYKSRDEVDLGCRGSIRLLNSFVRPHEADDCRFEIRVGDSIWYLRGTTIHERRKWIESIEVHRISESGYGSEQNLRRQNSWHSLNSANSLSIASASSFKRNHRLKEKLAEMDTFKEILNRQVESLQNYFDTCSAIVRDSAHDQLEQYLLDDQHSNNIHIATGNGVVHVSHATGQSHDRASISSDSVNSESTGNSVHSITNAVVASPPLPSVVINNGLIESANNGTIFEDARENLSENNASPDSHQSQDKPSTPTKDVPAPQQRGFISKFFSFRSNNNSSNNTNTTSNPTTVRKVNREDNSTNLSPSRAIVEAGDEQTYSQDNNNSFQHEDCSNHPVFDDLNDSEFYSQHHLHQPVYQLHNQLHHQVNPVISNLYYHQAEQYEPSSRFDDLKKIIKQHGGHAVDFKGESYTFKATTTGILTNLGYCIEIMQQREESWRRRLDREIERRKRLEECQRGMMSEISQLQNELAELKSTCHSINNSTSNGPMKLSAAMQAVSSHNNSIACTGINGHNTMESSTTTSLTTAASNKLLIVGSPDLQEGPTCTIGEEEFFDAIDATLDQMELADERKAALQRQESQYQSTDRQSLQLDPEHELYSEVESVVRQHIVYCDPTARELRAEDGWILQSEDGQMRIYNKELENDNGVVMDPLHIVHEVSGVTAREFCYYFWDVRYRMDWEIAIDQPPTILEYCAADTVLLHQVYKRVWPTTQRDSVYWSHIRQVDRKQLIDSGLNTACSADFDSTDMWLVLNYSTDHKAPQEDPNAQMIRLMLDVVLICQTVYHKPSGCSRDDISCRVLYASSINPGGWAPASVLRSVARREYPRFIKRFSQYVQDKTHNLPL